MTEFALALIPFLYVLLAVVDFGRGVYTNNGVAEAAREIARVASVHPCIAPCTSATWSAEILSAVNTQKKLVPGITTSGITIDCTDISDTTVTLASGRTCGSGNFVRVKVVATFRLVTPWLPIPNPMTVSSTSHIRIQ
jgi:Flp pilus assembly protein TadG